MSPLRRIRSAGSGDIISCARRVKGGKATTRLTMSTARVSLTMVLIAMMIVPRFDVTRSLRISFIPLWRFRVVRNHDESQSDHAIDFFHVGVIDLLPMIAHFVIVGINKRRA